MMTKAPVESGDAAATIKVEVSMHESIRFGRVAGIAIGINWSVLVIAALVTWGLADETLPTSYPGHSAAAYWAVATVASVIFFASLLAHELGHSIVARRHGVDVEAITLWMLGGVAKLEGGATNARDELRIAAVGPAVSMVLSFLFGLMALALDLVGAPELFVAAFGWLATINFVLAVFNLMPAFPLDGGRVLRALLWGAWHDQLRATRAAAASGRVFGYLMVVLGLFASMGGAGVSGVWFVFIGLFITFASTAEAAQTERDVLLGGLRVGDVMTSDPLTAPGTISVASLVDQYILRQHVSAYPVVDDLGRPVALMTLERVRAVPVERRSQTDVRTAAAPIDHVVVVAPDEPVQALIPRLARSREGRALVIDRGRLVGIVSHTDIIRALELRQLTPQRPAVPAS